MRIIFTSILIFAGFLFVQMQTANAQDNAKTIVSGGVLNGKAISKPQPAYPPIARASKASGTVTVSVLVNEDGNVISAKAIKGHKLLRQAAVEAALQAKFAPTTAGKKVKVSGLLTYEFEYKE